MSDDNDLTNNVPNSNEENQDTSTDNNADDVTNITSSPSLFQANWEWKDSEGETHVEPFLYPDENGELEDYIRKYIAPEYEQDFPVDRTDWAITFLHDVNAKGTLPFFQLQPAPLIVSLLL